MFRNLVAFLVVTLIGAAASARPAQRCSIDLAHSPQWICNQDDGTACSVTDAEVNQMFWPGSSCGITTVNEDTTDAVAWTQETANGGWETSGDATDDEGIQILIGASNSTASNGPCVFSPGDAYYMKVKFSIPVVADYDVAIIGFRNDGAFSSSGTVDDVAEWNTTTPVYDDFAVININAGDWRTYTQDDGGTATDTNITTTTAVGGTAYTAMLKVSSAGAVTYFVDGTNQATSNGAVAFTLDQAAADLYVPTVVFGRAAAGTDDMPDLLLLECGLQ